MKKTGKIFKAAVFAGVATAALALSSAHAAVSLYATSFEPPTFTTGSSIVGVDGWTVGSSTSVSQTASTTHASNGTQGLQFDNTGANNSFYSVIHPLGTFGTSAVTLTLDLYIPSTNGADRLGEVMFSTGTLGSCVLGVSIDGAGDIKMGKAWSALYSTSSLATAPAGTFADRWLRATLTFDPATAGGSVTLSGFGGATTSYTSSFTAVTTPTNTNLGSDYIGTTARLGSVYYDNLAIGTNAVPEPSTVAAALLGAGVLGVVIRRRSTRRVD